MSTTVVIPQFRVTRTTTVLLVLSLVALSLSAAPARERSDRLVSVIVQSFAGSEEAAAAVEEAGGKVERSFPIVGGVAAKVSPRALDALRGRRDILQVVPNDEVKFHKAFDGSKTAHQLSSVIRSDKLWNEGVTGRGVTVALLDTGVYDHADLAGRVVHCEDFSHERGTEAHCADTFGHGTFMAGLIAGNGTSSNGKYRGSAPEANIVSVKAAGFDGSTDISTILAGIQWVVAHKDVYGIKVLNLSLGSDSAQDYRMSPLNFAVQKAWSEGITVVVSASNSGPDSQTITKPGDDPFVITVGASNHEGNVDIKDDQVPVFSGRGPTRSNGLLKPDVVAPGVHTVSLRSPGSAIDQNYGSTAVVDGSYFKGTGTSMSTAYTTGAVAQMLQATPSLNPNQVKFRLVATARQIAEIDPLAAGKGIIDAYGAARSSLLDEANQNVESSSGRGLLEDARGSFEVDIVTPLGSASLNGEFAAQFDADSVGVTNPVGLVPYSSLTYTTTGWDGTTWKGTTWKTEDWTGTTWKGTTWKATVWDGTTWKGTTWKNADWEGTTWKNADWDGTTWKGTTWKSTWYAAAWD